MSLIHVVHWSTERDSGIVGVWDDDHKDDAEQAYDLLADHGGASRTYYLDSYPLNQVRKPT